MVEDPGHEYAKKSLSHIDECKRFREMAKEMESACDAMLEDRVAEAPDYCRPGKWPEKARK